MKKPTQFYLHRLLGLCPMILLACSHEASRLDLDNSLQVEQVIEQIVQSTQQAIALEPESSAQLESIDIDLLVGQLSDAKISIPILSVPSNLTANNQISHHVAMNFKPPNSFQPTSANKTGDLAQTNKDTELVATLRSVLRSIRSPKNGFLFQKGSVQIQCELKKTGASGLNIPLLTPLQIGVDHTHSITHSITLNFVARTGFSTLVNPAPVGTDSSVAKKAEIQILPPAANGSDSSTKLTSPSSGSPPTQTLPAIDLSHPSELPTDLPSDN